LTQPIEEIKSHLRQRNFRSFKSYIDSMIEKTNQNISPIRWTGRRPIVDNIQEGSIVISTLRDFDGVSHYDNYSIRLLTYADKIFFYDFAKSIYKKIANDEIESDKIPIDNFKDVEQYKRFLTLYQKTYKADLD